MRWKRVHGRCDLAGTHHASLKPLFGQTVSKRAKSPVEQWVTFSSSGSGGHPCGLDKGLSRTSKAASGRECKALQGWVGDGFFITSGLGLVTRESPRRSSTSFQLDDDGRVVGLVPPSHSQNVVVVSRGKHPGFIAALQMFTSTICVWGVFCALWRSFKSRLQDWRVSRCERKTLLSGLCGKCCWFLVQGLRATIPAATACAAAYS